jgi:hypothetical protein
MLAIVAALLPSRGKGETERTIGLLETPSTGWSLQGKGTVGDDGAVPLAIALADSVLDTSGVKVPQTCSKAAR